MITCLKTSLPGTLSLVLLCLATTAASVSAQISGGGGQVAIIGTKAGNGIAGSSGNGGAATSAELDEPAGVAVDGMYNIYIADTVNNVIRKVTASTGDISIVAGDGSAGYSGDGAAATSAMLSGPLGVAVDARGNIYIADSGNSRVRVVYSSGTIPNVVNPTVGYIYTVAGDGTIGYSGDGGTATSAELDRAAGVAIDTAGNLYIADHLNNRIRKVTASTGVISTVAGNGTAGYSGDGGAAISAKLNNPMGVAVDRGGNIYVADTANSRIREVTAYNGYIATIAGTGTPGYSGDGGAATSAELAAPSGVTVDNAGNLYIADTNNSRIREVAFANNGYISTFAGGGSGCGAETDNVGDNCSPTDGILNTPAGLAIDGSVSIYIADTLNNRIRQVGGSSNIYCSFTGSSLTLRTSSPPFTAVTMFYTLDGSPATEASTKYPGSAITVPPGVSKVNVVSALTQANHQPASTAVIQHGETTFGDWVTNVGCASGSCGPYPNTPNVQYGVSGVTGTPTTIGFYTSPTNPHPWALASGSTTNLTFSSNGGETEVLWPYSPSHAPPESCDTCNTLVEDFYLWPQLNSSGTTAVHEWETDLIYYNLTTNQEPGASLQCSIDDTGWDFNYQGSAPWKHFYVNPPTNTQKITQDCDVSGGQAGLPYGTLTSSGISSSTQTSFSLLGYRPPSSVIEDMIVLVDSEEILCQLTANSTGGSTCNNAVRGWAGTSPAAHPYSSTRYWIGSVHVQYHVSLYPGNRGCSLSGVSVDCAFIDYLNLNGVSYNFHAIYGEYGTTGYWGLPVPVPTLPYSNVDGILNQMQMDEPSASATQVGEYLDQNNLTASWGVQAIQSCTLP